MNFSTIIEYLINHIEAVIFAAFLVISFVVNIIQAIRTKDVNKLKKVINDLPNIIREVEVLFTNSELFEESLGCTTTAASKSICKKSMAESLLITKYGKKFVNKYIGVLDDSIEDILNTPQRKGGSYELSKKDEEK